MREKGGGERPSETRDGGLRCADPPYKLSRNRAKRPGAPDRLHDRGCRTRFITATISTCCDDSIAGESVDLIYFDPPFNSQASYNVLFKGPSGKGADAQIEAFEDTWHWGEGAERAFSKCSICPTRTRFSVPCFRLPFRS